LYSTMWFDGYLHGTIWSSRPPWNDMLLISTALLALIPLSILTVGALRAVFTKQASLRWPLAICVLTVGIYLAALSNLYLRLPVYSAAKGTYLLGLLPCFAVLAAAGFDALRGLRGIGNIVFAALLTWATCVYAAYFIR
jgi:hypothetical protein